MGDLQCDVGAANFDPEGFAGSAGAIAQVPRTALEEMAGIIEELVIAGGQQSAMECKPIVDAGEHRKEADRYRDQCENASCS